MVASDHSPGLPEMKDGSDFLNAWGGISGCQSLLSLLLTDGYARRKLPLITVARVTAEYVAGRFGVAPGKGRIEVGADADLVSVNLAESYVLGASDLLYRHRYSPYVGRTLQGRVVGTIVRGMTVYLDGKVVSSPIGKPVRPNVKRET
jgi:allantoinase